MGLFRYSAGRAGFNLVTVFRRYEGGPIYIETWPGGKRRKQTLRKTLGAPLYDEKRAMHIADLVATKIERAAHGEIDKLLGIPEKKTLKDLLDAYHEKRGRRWGTNKRHQELAKAFWIKRLGATTDARRVAGMVSDIEAIAAEEAAQRNWSPRTEGKYLKYLRTAFNFGRKKLKWFDEKHDLSALEIPPPDSVGESYSLDETRKLLAGTIEIDLRCAVAARIAYVSLRRIGAIRQLRTDNVKREGDDIAIYVHRSQDKVRKSGEVMIGDTESVELIERLLKTPAVKASGLLFPNGDLNDKSASRRPVRYELLNDWLIAAEKVAGVARVKGRGYHAFKRRAASEADKAGILGDAAQQAGTNEMTLRRVYVQHDRDRKQNAGKTLAKKVKGD
jgi:hypothetical protein